MNNNITLYGRLGQDAEEKILPSGQRLLNLSLATDNKRGGNKETVWWRITIWGDHFKNMEPYFKKGYALIVGGVMHYPRIYQDQMGENQASLEATAYYIGFNPFSRPEEETQGQGSQASHTQTKQPQQGQNIPSSPQQGQATDDVSKAFDNKYAFKEDEIPF